MASEEVVQPDLDAVVVENHRPPNVEDSVASCALRHTRRVADAGRRLIETSRFENAIQLCIERIENVSVERGEDRDAEAELASVRRQHPDRHDVEELGRRRLVHFATIAARGAVAFSQPHHFDDDQVAMGGDH